MDTSQVQCNGGLVRRRTKIVKPLPFLARLYIYAIHGYVTEVIFTAMWDFCLQIDWKFSGCSSIWSALTHGVGTLIIEQIAIRTGIRKRVPLLLRGLIYLSTTYSWEFISGYILRYFNACPWDYSHFAGDFLGLITLEYAPFWYVGSLLVEKVLIKYTRRLYFGPSVKPERLSYGNYSDFNLDLSDSDTDHHEHDD